MEIKRTCSYCKKTFFTQDRRNRCCSLTCKEAQKKELALWRVRSFRYHSYKILNNQNKSCQVCSFSETVDLHHEGLRGYWLCPNHHALITRGIKRVSDYGIKPAIEETIRKQNKHLPNNLY